MIEKIIIGVLILVITSLADRIRRWRKCAYFLFYCHARDQASRGGLNEFKNDLVGAGSTRGFSRAAAWIIDRGRKEFPL